METAGSNWRQVYTLRDFSALLFRQAPIAILCFMLVIALVVGGILLMPDRYQSEMRLLIKHDRADSLITAAPSDRAAPPDVTEQELNSEIELLQGQELLEQVAKSTGLDKRQADSGWAAVTRRLGLNHVNPADGDAALSRAVDDLRASLSIAPVRRTWMISVTYSSPDPKLSKSVLETLVKVYLEKHLAVRRPPGAHEFFAEQAKESMQELETAQGRLREFGARHGTVSAETEKDAVLAKVAEFEALRRQTDAALAEAGARLTTLQLERARTPARHTASVTTGDATGFTQEMQSKIAAMEMKRTELLQKYTPEYRLVVELDQQIRQARSALDEARTSQLKQETTAENPTMRWLENEIARVRSEHSALSARSKALQTSLARYRAEAQTLGGAGLEQADLLRAVKAAEDKYVLYQKKQEEARISDALDRTRISNVAIVQAATAPLEPQPRRSAMWLTIGLFVALMLSIGAALIKDVLTSSVRVRTPDELQTTLGDVPVLAWVPARARRA